MIRWLHTLFNPHCEHCARERKEQREQLREDKLCVSCESLARENDRLVRENERLLDLLLEKPSPVTDRITDVKDLKPISTTKIPFIPTKVRRELLERESRHSAQLAKNAAKPDAASIDVELKDLEKELDDVATKREEKTAS